MHPGLWLCMTRSYRTIWSLVHLQRSEYSRLLWATLTHFHVTGRSISLATCLLPSFMNGKSCDDHTVAFICHFDFGSTHTHFGVNGSRYVLPSISLSPLRLFPCLCFLAAVDSGWILLRICKYNCRHPADQAKKVWPSTQRQSIGESRQAKTPLEEMAAMI